MKAVMYGAGNIGRGFIGQLMSESGYEVVFVDVAAPVVEALNARHSYPVRLVSNEGSHEVTVDNVRAVMGTDEAAVIREICEADLMATAVGAPILPRIAPLVARGLLERFRQGRPPLDIIICENLLDANLLFKKWIAEALPPGSASFLDTYVGFVEASIGRMVPVMTAAMQQGDILRIWVEPYAELPVDGGAFVGPVPPLENIIPFSPFDFYIQRKLFIHNLGHAACAYLGFLKGYRYIWEAVVDGGVRAAAGAAMEQSAAALSSRFGVPLSVIRGHIRDLLGRFGNRELGDTVARVGKDPLRKLSPNDRLVGAVGLCRRQGLPCDRILFALAAALRFSRPDDAASLEMQSMIAQKGPEGFLEQWCALSSQDIAECLIFYRQLSPVQGK
jgi:mannitol-1-phosphate 5-dehydrogenase